MTKAACGEKGFISGYSRTGAEAGGSCKWELKPWTAPYACSVYCHYNSQLPAPRC